MPTPTKHPRPASNRRTKPQRRPKAGNGLREMRERFALSQALVARLLDVSVRTISGAEADSVGRSPLRRSLTQANRLCEALAEVMDATFVGNWLDQPNEMLGGLRPVEAIERGQLDLVWQVVEGLRSGSPL